MAEISAQQHTGTSRSDQGRTSNHPYHDPTPPPLTSRFPAHLAQCPLKNKITIYWRSVQEDLRWKLIERGLHLLQLCALPPTSITANEMAFNDLTLVQAQLTKNQRSQTA